MASPQEVLERAIPHPMDATPESIRANATFVLKALAANDYAFVRRPRLVSAMDDGQCPKCLTELVHVDHGPIYMDAAERMNSMAARLQAYHRALIEIAAGANNAAEIAKGVVG